MYTYIARKWFDIRQHYTMIPMGCLVNQLAPIQSYYSIGDFDTIVPYVTSLNFIV